MITLLALPVVEPNGSDRPLLAVARVGAGCAVTVRVAGACVTAGAVVRSATRVLELELGLVVDTGGLAAARVTGRVVSMVVGGGVDAGVVDAGVVTTAVLVADGVGPGVEVVGRAAACTAEGRAAVEVSVRGMNAGRADGEAPASRAAPEAWWRGGPSERLIPTATTAHPATASDAVTEATARPNVMGPV